MKFSDFRPYTIIIIIALLLLLVVSVFVIHIISYQPDEISESSLKDFQPNPQQSPVASSTIEHFDSEYCIIEEVHPDFLKKIPHFVNPNATIVSLKSVDLEPFPVYQKLMADETKLTKKWQDGHRFIGDFIDYQCKFSDFQNISCKDSPDSACNPRKSSLVYEYNARYFTIGCFQDFSGGTPPPPPS